MTATAMQTAQPSDLYRIDDDTRRLLVELAPLMLQWSKTMCSRKSTGGMEEWAKGNHANGDQVLSCDWYHGTWQFLRLLNMVAVPPWYGFYNDALTSVLKRQPTAKVLISACADCGMLATLHQAIEASDANPEILIYDICKTPLRSCKWYANRHGLDVRCVCDNIITSSEMPIGSFDLIVTDEFLTVLKKEYKPMITKRWLELLAPEGTVITTAMIGEPTTDELRWSYADRARALTAACDSALGEAAVDRETLLGRFEQFAIYHTRHMLTGEDEIRDLFADFDLSFFEVTPTPGECVNPTHSFQIVAHKPA
jgi:hypothetical protein